MKVFTTLLLTSILVALAISFPAKAQQFQVTSPTTSALDKSIRFGNNTVYVGKKCYVFRLRRSKKEIDSSIAAQATISILDESNKSLYRLCTAILVLLGIIVLLQFLMWIFPCLLTAICRR